MTATVKTGVDFIFGLSADSSAAQGEEMRQALASRFPDCTFLFDHTGASFMEDWILPVAADRRAYETDCAALEERAGPSPSHGPSPSQVIAAFRNELKRVRDIRPC